MIKTFSLGCVYVDSEVSVDERVCMLVPTFFQVFRVQVPL